jgi:hypothetical protein
MRRVVEERKAMKQVVIERYAREPQRALRGGFEVQPSAGFTHPNAVAKELDRFRYGLDYMARDHQIECIVSEGQLIRIQIGALEREPFGQWPFRIAIVHAEMLQAVQAETASYLD